MACTFLLQQSSDHTMTLADFWEIYRTDIEKHLRRTTMKQKGNATFIEDICANAKGYESIG